MNRKLWLAAVAVVAAAGAGYGVARDPQSAVALGSITRCECSPATALEKGGYIYHCACGSLYCAVVGPGQQQSTLACAK